MGLATKVYGGITATLTATDDLTSLSSVLNMTTLLKSMASGTGDNQADLMFADTRTLSASATENLDLAGGLTSPFGATLTFVKVKAILVKAAAGNTNNVVVGGAASNTFNGPFVDASDKISIPPGGADMFFAPVTGWTVTAGSGDILKVANSAGTTGVTYDIVIIGTSA